MYLDEVQADLLVLTELTRNSILAMNSNEMVCGAASTSGIMDMLDTSSIDRNSANQTSERGERKDGRTHLVDDFFADLERQFKQKK